MAANISVLDSDKVSAFTSHHFGNILAGNSSDPKLVFIISDGDATANSVEFGASAVAGNDGYTFTELCTAQEIDASSTNIQGTVDTTGGSIPDSPSLIYRLTVKDNYGHESEMDSATYAPSLTAGVTTHKVNLNWTAAAGAAEYGVYVSKDGGTTYKLVAYTANTSYEDLNSNQQVNNPPATGEKAYATTAWQDAESGNLSLGNMAPNDITGVFFRELITSGTTAAGNTRHHKVFTTFTT